MNELPSFKSSVMGAPSIFIIINCIYRDEHMCEFGMYSLSLAVSFCLSHVHGCQISVSFEL